MPYGVIKLNPKRRNREHWALQAGVIDASAILSVGGEGGRQPGEREDGADLRNP